MKTTVLVKIDQRDPDFSRIREVARGSREGKIVAFPTETVYGMGGPMSIPSIQDRLIELKRRDEHKRFSYHIGEWDMVDLLGVQTTQAFRFLARKFWPGPLTLVVFNKASEKIGLRFPRHRVAVTLINATGEPFIATSANLSGQSSPKTAESVMEQFGGQIDYVIDSGPCEVGIDSTVVDLTGPEPVMLREGASASQIRQAIEDIKAQRYPHKRILIVCTGNSCRSPMAEGWLQDQLARKGLARQIEVFSRGIAARDGGSATAEAIYVMKNREIDISNHVSHPCRRQDIIDSDLIIAMSPQHASFITGMVPSAKEKIIVLDVPDPIGMDMPVYEQVIELIEKGLREHWERIIR